jgi:hypothetical protein
LPHLFTQALLHILPLGKPPFFRKHCRSFAAGISAAISGHIIASVSGHFSATIVGHITATLIFDSRLP